MADEKYTIFVAEDTDVVREAIERELKKDGYDVITASTYEKAETAIKTFATPVLAAILDGNLSEKAKLSLHGQFLAQMLKPMEVVTIAHSFSGNFGADISVDKDPFFCFNPEEAIKPILEVLKENDLIKARKKLLSQRRNQG